MFLEQFNKYLLLFDNLGKNGDFMSKYKNENLIIVQIRIL